MTEQNAIADLNAQLVEMDEQIVCKAEGFAFTRAELRAAFELVEDKQNWKQPIDAFVPAASCFSGQRLLVAIEQAVHFFAGMQTVRIDRLPLGGLRVRAAGYYRTIGA